MGFSYNKVEPFTSSNVVLLINSFVCSIKNRMCEIYMNNVL
jgi:hypothetical protein